MEGKIRPPQSKRAASREEPIVIGADMHPSNPLRQRRYHWLWLPRALQQEAIQIVQFDCTMLRGLTRSKLAALWELNHAGDRSD